MNCNQFSKKWSFLITSLIVVLLIVSLPIMSEAAESGEFNGTWVANGSRVEFPFSADREIYTFEVSGHVSLKTKVGHEKNYWSECVGFSDTAIGVIARCVWKDLNGAEIYLSLKSEALHAGGEVTGTIVGGSDHLEGISGDLSFIWSSFSMQKDADQSMVMGQTLDLHGRYQLP